MWPAYVTLRKCGSVDHGWYALEKAGALVYECQIWRIEIRRFSHWQTVKTLVAFSKVMKLLNRVQHGDIQHLAPFCPLILLTAAQRIRPIHITSDLHPVDSIPKPHISRGSTG
jgi:hypothetical protein